MAAQTSAIGATKWKPVRKPKRTSQGLRHAPLNKHKRNGWKRYRGQGRPG